MSTQNNKNLNYDIITSRNSIKSKENNTKNWKNETFYDIQKILSIIDFDNIDDIVFLSLKIETLFLELFDTWNINNFQAINILEYLFSKLKQDNTQNAKKAYEILIMLFSIYLYENNKLKDFEKTINTYFNLKSFEEYLFFVIKYINRLDNHWIKAKIIIRYISLPANYNRNVNSFLNGNINQKEFSNKLKENLSLHEEIYSLIISRLYKQKDVMNINKKKVLFKYINTFFSFNNYNYILLHIFSKSKSIAEQQYISKLLQSYISSLSMYIKFILQNKDYLNNISYRSLIVLYTNIYFWSSLAEEKNKKIFKEFLSIIKNLLIEKFWKHLQKSFDDNDEYAQFIKHYTGESISDDMIVKNNDNNLINILTTTNLWDNLFILSNTIWVYPNIKKTARTWLLLMPDNEKNALLSNQQIFYQIQLNNAYLLNQIKKNIENGHLKLKIKLFLKYLSLILNIEYNKSNIKVKFFIDDIFLNKINNFWWINLNIFNIAELDDFEDYLIKDNALYIKFNIKTIYWSFFIVLWLDIKNIQEYDIIKQNIFDIQSIWKLLAEQIFYYIEHIAHLQEKLKLLKYSHKETMQHMENVWYLSFNLASLIKDNELELFERYAQNQFFLQDKQEFYKFLWYMHDIWKSYITDRLNNFSIINQRIDVFKLFYKFFLFIFKDIKIIEPWLSYYINIETYKENIDNIITTITNNNQLNKLFEEIITKSEIISIDENFSQKIIKSIIDFVITYYDTLSENVWNEQIIVNNNYEVILKKWIDINKFLWIILWLIKLSLNKIINKIQYPHIKEWFNFVKTNQTFSLFTLTFFHHNYPDIKELKHNWILEILKNIYKNIWVWYYIDALNQLDTENLSNQSYPDNIKDPIMVITAIADILEALVLSKRNYQLDEKEISELIENINSLNINKYIKDIFLSSFKMETKSNFDEQYIYVLTILDKIFKNNLFYKRIRNVLELEKFKDKLRDIQ